MKRDAVTGARSVPPADCSHGCCYPQFDADPAPARPAAGRRRVGSRRAVADRPRSVEPAGPQDAPQLPRRGAVGADRRRAPGRRAAALACPRRHQARVGAELHQPGRRADPPRADRPGAALRRAARPGAPSRQPGRIGRYAGRRRRRPRTPGTRRGWRPGPTSTKRPGRCRTTRGKSSTSSGIKGCRRPRPPRSWGLPSGW